MNATAGPRRLGFGVFTFVLIVVLTGLSLWQLQRRAEKHALIAALSQRLAAAPQPLPAAAQWSAMEPTTDEFRRVTLKAAYMQLPDAMVYSAGSAVRDDISGAGTWAFIPARLASGETVVINAGFIANTMQDRGVEDRAVKALVRGAAETMTGYIRFPEAAGWLTPAENPAKRLWFVRDHLAMAKSLGWGGVAPFYIDLEQPVPPNGIPKPGPLSVHLKDDHLQYAITWFALAGVLAVAFAFWLRGQRRFSPG
jgi:cytochrome oxidase assembly protein ShyY1